MARTHLDLDNLVEHWTLLKDEQALVSGKRGATRLGFAVLLKFYTQHGRFPRGRFELPGEAVEFVARQVQVPAAELDAYEWSGRTVEYHRAQIRGHLGFRECSVADADKLTAWLAEYVACKERRPEQVRVELLARCRAESIEPPTPGRCDRIVGAALRVAEEMLTARISARLTVESTERIVALVAGADQEDDAVPGKAGTGEGEDGPPVLGKIKEAPGNVSLETMLTEIDKLLAVRAVGLPADLFADVAPKVVAGWRARAAVESPSVKLYRPVAGEPDAYPQLTPALTRPIRWELIAQQYDQMIKYATAIRTRTASTESILRRFTRNASHPTYAAMLEVGRAQKTIFVARYLRLRDLQREIEEGLNVMESSDGANSVIAYGKGGEIASNRRDEQEMFVLCLRILQSALVYVNTLMLQGILGEPEWADLLTPADRRGLTPLFWSHVRPYGEVNLDMGARLNLSGVTVPGPRTSEDERLGQSTPIATQPARR